MNKYFTHYPSLLLVLDSEQARWFKVKRTNIEPLDELHDSYERYSDAEGFFKSRSPHSHAIKAGAPEVENRRRRVHHQQHIRTVAEKTRRLWSSQPFRHLSCAVPDTYAHTLPREIHDKLPTADVHVVRGIHTHEDEAQLRNLFLKSLRPPGK